MPSGFHPGELAVQRRAGVAGQAAPLASMLAEDQIPGVAADFLAAQPLVLVGHQDDAGGVWASVLHGRPGFALAPGPRQVVLDAAPASGDALGRSLGAGPRAVGLLAIEPATRRRMRINGTATREAGGPVVVATESVYANCPKYISTRELGPHSGHVTPGPAEHGVALDVEQRALLLAADTFFVASVHHRAGADVSHRGGRPGFVRVDSSGTRVSWPDYRGNAMFNTLGNLELDPRAGLLFLDWSTGDALQIRGRARIDWAPERAAEFPRAERVVDLDVEEVVALPGALGGVWRFGQLSKVSPPAA